MTMQAATAEPRRKFLNPVKSPKPRKVEIDNKQARLWEQTRAMLLWDLPGFCHIFYTLMCKGVEGSKAYFTDEVPIAATDGDYMFINPEKFFANYTLPQRVFIAAHEISHAMMGHMILLAGIIKRDKVAFTDGTELPYVDEIMQHAMDYVINDMLINSKVGGEKGKPPGLLHDPTLITYKDSVVDAYRKLYKKCNGKPPSGSGFDVHLAPGTGKGQDTQSAVNDHSPQEWKTAIASAMASAKAQGKLPAAMDHVFGELLEPQVNWQERIVAFLARKVGSGSWDWKRPDKRLIVRDIYAPARTGKGAKCIVVAGDTSGSIGPKTIDLFFGEMSGILEDVRPERLVIMWCDAKVHRVDEAEDTSDLLTIRAKGAPGRGGTAFGPVFDKIEELGLEPDALVYLTDLMGSFPEHPPKYPVLWCTIMQGKAPFGEVIDIPRVPE